MGDGRSRPAAPAAVAFTRNHQLIGRADGVESRSRQGGDGAVDSQPVEAAARTWSNDVAGTDRVVA